MIVTLGRQCGCAGDEIGRKLSELLGIPFYTKPELIALAKEKKIYEKYPMYFGEQPVNAMISSVADDFCSNQYDTPKKALAALFGKESFIIIGRASNYAYREDQNAIRVFLCGDKKLRAQHIAEKHKISDRKAMALVEKTDEKRRGYHRYYTGEEWGYAENYGCGPSGRG
jgi:cytidylate kinase